MAIKNIKGLLTQATALPVAIEAKLPAGAPKVSTMLLDATGKMPDLPDFPIELPALPAVPALPAMPGMPELGRRYVSAVEVRETQTSRSAPTPLVQEYTQPIEGVLGQVTTRRGM